MGNKLTRQKWDYSLVLFGGKKTIHLHRVAEGIKPAIAGAIGIVEAEAMSSILMEVKFLSILKFLLQSFQIDFLFPSGL